MIPHLNTVVRQALIQQIRKCRTYKYRWWAPTSSSLTVCSALIHGEKSMFWCNHVCVFPRRDSPLSTNSDSNKHAYVRWFWFKHVDVPRPRQSNHAYVTWVLSISSVWYWLSCLRPPRRTHMWNHVQFILQQKEKKTTSDTREYRPGGLQGEW